MTAKPSKPPPSPSRNAIAGDPPKAERCWWMAFTAVLARIASHVGRRDALAVLGLAALTWGLWLVSMALAAVVAGALLLYVGLFWGRA